MAKAFEFADFVDEFAVEFTVFDEAVNGYYDDLGKWVDGNSQVDNIIYHSGDFALGSSEEVVGPGEGLSDDDGETSRMMSGIILPLNNDELRFETNGGYTSKDRKIYTKEPLKIGQHLEYKNQRYTIHENKPYDDYADVFIYFAKGLVSDEY